MVHWVWSIVIWTLSGGHTCWIAPKYVLIRGPCIRHWNRSGYEVVTTSDTTSWYTVVRTSFCIAFPCLKVGISSCTVGYTVTWFSITWVRSCMIICQLSIVHMVKSVELHIILCNCVSWSCDNLVPAPTPSGSSMLEAPITRVYVNDLECIPWSHSWKGGEGLSYLNVVGNFPGDWPYILAFANPVGSLFYAQLDLIVHLFLQKKSVCLYHI